MPSLLEALSDGFDTVGAKVAGSDFVRKLEIYKNSIVNEYMKYNIDLNKSIAKIAQKDNLNDDQIQRIVEEVNNQVYLIKYNQMKNSPDRDVVFDLASLSKVKQEITGGDSGVVEKASYDTGYGMSSFEKKASWANEDGDAVNMFNHSSYEFASLSPELQRTKENIELAKIAEELKSIDSQIEKSMDKVAGDAHCVAHALIQYSRHGLDVQGIFNQICKSASCTAREQEIIKKAIAQKIGILKEARSLPQEYSLELEPADMKDAEFSLKQYSFVKEAEFNGKSNQSVPIVITDDSAIKDLNDLVRKINSISSNANTVRVDSNKRDDIVKAAGLTSEQAEKLAANGRGIVAFGKALTGVGAMSAKKKLDDSAKVLSKKVNNPALKGAQSEVSTLSKAQRNADIHPRMQNVNKTLADAFDKYDGIARKSDAVLNENALNHRIIKDILPSTIGAKVNRVKGKIDLHNTQNVANEQARRIKHDINDQLDNAKRKLANVENENDMESAVQEVRNAEKAYNKAVTSRKKARGVALVGAGAGIALNETRKRNQGEGSSLYY